MTNNYQVSLNATTGATLSYDQNGNMTSDGTNSYAYDAENRLIQVTYPGSSNYSSLTYDGLGRYVSIVETTAGSTTSTKQFVWSSGAKPLESRNVSGTITAQYSSHGEIIASTDYFYTADHLGSIHQLTNSSGTIESDRTYDEFGRVTVNIESVTPDFGYAGYYLHSRSGLNLTLTRAYNPTSGRFINRDTTGEGGGLNLYSYVLNNPVLLADPIGTDATGAAWGAALGYGAGGLVGAAGGTLALPGGGTIAGAGSLAPLGGAAGTVIGSAVPGQQIQQNAMSILQNIIQNTQAAINNLQAQLKKKKCCEKLALEKYEITKGAITAAFPDDLAFAYPEYLSARIRLARQAFMEYERDLINCKKGILPGASQTLKALFLIESDYL